MSPDACLTPEGARLLRMARDRIVAHPETFHWGRFCGTRCCIAGQILIAHGGERFNRGDVEGLAAELLGFSSWGPCFSLFYGFKDADRFDTRKAAAAIEAFLWAYRFPPNDLSPQQPATLLECLGVTPAPPRGVDDPR